jgi:hypothetical protein
MQQRLDEPELFGLEQIAVAVADLVDLAVEFSGVCVDSRSAVGRGREAAAGRCWASR